MIDPSLPLQHIARELAGPRRSSIVLLEIKALPGELHCEDAGSLQPKDGRVNVLSALVAALRSMLEIAEATLALERAAASAELVDLGELMQRQSGGDV